MNYRRRIDNETWVLEQETVDGETDVITVSEATAIVEDIELLINNIQEMLQPIQGLSEIEDIREKLASLAEDLY